MPLRIRVPLLMLLLPVAAAAQVPRVFLDTTPEFCTQVQHALAGTQLPARNVIHTDFQAFKESKAELDPLTIHQYVRYADAAREQAVQVSCKTKSADILNALVGPGTATGGALSCRDVQRAIVMSVWFGLTPAERAAATDPPDRILLDADTTTIMGNNWVKEYEPMYRDADGRLHLHSKALKVDWDNVWLSWAPDRVRGVHYCHFVAPEALRRELRG